MIWGCLADFQSELLFGARCKRIAARRLTGFGAAQFQNVLARRLVAKVVIKGESPMDLGARKIHRFRDHRNHGFGDVAERLLHIVQNRHHRTRGAAMRGNDFRGALCIQGS